PGRSGSSPCRRNGRRLEEEGPVLMNKKAVGLDLRADGWTALEVVRRGRTGLDDLEVVNLARGKWEPKAAPEARGEMLKAAFRQQKISRHGLVVSLPSGPGQWERPTLPGLSPPLVKTAFLADLAAKLSR